jgi:hypothetical protein
MHPVMIRSVSISGYRGLNNFVMSDLGQVNLLVGKNNSGKSSVLEALFLLASGGDPWALWQISSRRGERIEAAAGRTPDAELDLSHLFHGHEIRPGAKISVTARNRVTSRIELSINEQSRGDTAELIPSESGELPSQRLMLEFSGQPTPSISAIPLTSRGGLRLDLVDAPRRVRRSHIDRARAQYVSTESLSAVEATLMWNEIVLTDAEDRVLTALRFLEPKIERLAATAAPREYLYGSSRGGFKIKLRDTAQPIPIGSLGDGIWRMLAMAMALIRAKGSILLVDEIDTGLHYSVMEDMWTLISATAAHFNVQVFATTHSQDCVQSLATICGPSRQYSATIQRVEAGRRKSIPFNEAEIRIASAKNIEIR